LLYVAVQHLFCSRLLCDVLIGTDTQQQNVAAGAASMRGGSGSGMQLQGTALVPRSILSLPSHLFAAIAMQPPPPKQRRSRQNYSLADIITYQRLW
jgi:hypothetical protein